MGSTSIFSGLVVLLLFLLDVGNSKMPATQWCACCSRYDGSHRISCEMPVPVAYMRSSPPLHHQLFVTVRATCLRDRRAISIGFLCSLHYKRAIPSCTGTDLLLLAILLLLENCIYVLRMVVDWWWFCFGAVWDKRRTEELTCSLVRRNWFLL